MKMLSILLLIITLSGCATMQYGNFTTTSKNNNKFMANDAVSQLSRIYPPARTTFYISQNSYDDFGSYIIRAMRQKGYGVMENVRPKQSANFFYTVDEIKTNQCYRVSIHVRSQLLSRMYTKTNNTLTPISIWSYKE